MQNYDDKQEKTLVLVKPDGVQRGLIGEAIRRYEQSGLKLVAIKMAIPSKDKALTHYSVDPEWAFKTGTKSIEAWKAKGLTPPTEDPIELAEGVRQQLVTFLSSGPVVAMVWQGMNAIGVIRKITGGTEPLTSVPGTIRGDYTIDSYRAADTDHRAVRNIIHASGSVEEANKEIAIWFTPEEVLNYRLVSEAIIYDTNLDGILD
ncbi:MAG TPA: nucleoside-diphosphate kinase [Candidatus Woesebacteria bacterium]|nr:nucleoside-diphosphate kinase [Candidatus Woesebacteria bacterium]HPJ17074.1 nucleoside-diphosphate kinase [Candidatus Woesebacteria bacterium]